MLRVKGGDAGAAHNLSREIVRDVFRLGRDKLVSMRQQMQRV